MQHSRKTTINSQGSAKGYANSTSILQLLRQIVLMVNLHDKRELDIVAPLSFEEHYGQKEGPHFSDAVFKPDVFYKHLIKPL